MTFPMDTPGKYTVTMSHGEIRENITVDVDRMEYDQNGSLVAVKGDEVVAVFRWWDAVVKKGE